MEFQLDNIRWESTVEVGQIENPGFEDAVPTNEVNLWDENIETGFYYIPGARWQAFLDGGADADFELVNSVDGEVYGGEKSLAVSVNTALASDPYFIEILHKDIPVSANQSYDVSVWVYSEGGDFRLRASVQLPDISVLEQAIVEVPQGEWTQIVLNDVLIPEGESSVRFLLHMNYAQNNGLTLYLDDLTIK